MQVDESVYSALHKINQGVPKELVDALIKWLCGIELRASGFRVVLDKGWLYKITPSPTAPNGGIQVWINQDSGGLDGPGLTPNHELWRNNDGTFTIKDDLEYG